MLLATEIKVTQNIKDYQLSFDKDKGLVPLPTTMAPLSYGQMAYRISSVGKQIYYSLSMAAKGEKLKSIALL